MVEVIAENTQPEQAQEGVQAEAGPQADIQRAIREARERAPKIKEGKVIVRNLGFDLREKHL